MENAKTTVESKIVTTVQACY